jgi:Tol biopolymer transport system component
MIRAGCVLFICFLSFDLTGQDQFIYTPLERGSVRSGQRSGVWQYFDYPGKLGLEINYETMEVLEMAPDTSKYVVKEGHRWTRQQLKSPCRPHGSLMNLQEHYFRKLDANTSMFTIANRKNKPVETLLTFEVGPDGVSTSPKVWGYTKFGMEKMIMEAYASAPNLWIPGIKMDGSVATCRFGLYVKICPEACPKVVQSDTVRLIHIAGNFNEKSYKRYPLTREPVGMVLSPDGKWIAMSAGIMTNTGGDGIFIIPTEAGNHKRINFGDIHGMYWLNNTNISFKYSYSLSGIVQGNYNLATGLVSSRRDSIYYFERISPDRTTLFAGRIQNDFLEVVKVNLITKTTEVATRKPGEDMFPVMWSPENQACLIKSRKDQADMLYHFDVTTGKLTQLPLMDAEPCGWSADGRHLYLQRSTPFVSQGYSLNPSFKGQLFGVDTKTNLLREVTKTKLDNFITAEFSTKANRFLMIQNNDLYLFSLGEVDKPQKIINGVTYAVWSPDGMSIAYVAEKGTVLSLYEVSSGERRMLFQTGTK